MDEKILNSFHTEKDRIESQISFELGETDIREIQREELKLLNAILQQLKSEESTRDLSWEKNNLFYSISLLHHNIRFYPTLPGLISPLTFIDKAINEKDELTPNQKKEMEHVNIDLLIHYIKTLFNLVDGE